MHVQHTECCHVLYGEEKEILSSIFVITHATDELIDTDFMKVAFLAGSRDRPVFSHLPNALGDQVLKY